MVDNFINFILSPEFTIAASQVLVLLGIAASLFFDLAKWARNLFVGFALIAVAIVTISTWKQYQRTAESEAARDEYLVTLKAKLEELKGVTTKINELTKQANTNIDGLTTGAATTIAKFDSLEKETGKITGNMQKSAQSLSDLVVAAKASGAAGDKHYQQLMSFAEATAKAQRQFLECLTDQIEAAAKGTTPWHIMGCTYTPPKAVEELPTVPQTAP